MTYEPCPFCGGRKIAQESNDSDEFNPSKWWMQCLDCGAQGPVVEREEGLPLSHPDIGYVEVSASVRWDNRA